MFSGAINVLKIFKKGRHCMDETMQIDDRVFLYNRDPLYGCATDAIQKNHLSDIIWSFRLIISTER